MVELPREAAAEVPRVPEAEAEARDGAAVRQPAEAARRDAAQRRGVRASLWAFHPDQHPPWPARPPSGWFGRARKLQRIAWP